MSQSVRVRSLTVRKWACLRRRRRPSDRARWSPQLGEEEEEEAEEREQQPVRKIPAATKPGLWTGTLAGVATADEAASVRAGAAVAMTAQRRVRC